MNINEFKQLPIMGILRGIDPVSIEPLAEAVISSGLKTIEIAMNTKDAPSLIKSMVKAAGGRFSIGAGTVVDENILAQALNAGASFIVLPTLVDEVVASCVSSKIPVFPGAFTPTEIQKAWDAGASMVKVFPIKFFGPSYIKEVKAPLNNIELLACGGVNNENIKSFFDSGASAVAFGESIFNKKLMASGKFDNISDSLKSLIKASGKLSQES